MNVQFLKAVAQYIASSSEVINGLQEKVAASQNELVTAQAQQKVASEKASVTIEAKSVATTVENMVKASMFKEAEREQAISQIQKDPAILLRFLNKLAEDKIRSTVVTIGKAVDKPAGFIAAGRKSDEVYEQRIGALVNRTNR